MLVASQDLASLLLRASESPFGIIISTNNPQVLRQRLYAERRKHGSAFTHLTFIQPPTNPSTSLWIVRKDTRHESQDNC